MRGLKFIVAVIGRESPPRAGAPHSGRRAERIFITVILAMSVSPPIIRQPHCKWAMDLALAELSALRAAYGRLTISAQLAAPFMRVQVIFSIMKWEPACSNQWQIISRSRPPQANACVDSIGRVGIGTSSPVAL